MPLGEPMKRCFFDVHMHAMNLSHPNFISFVGAVSDNIAEFVTADMLSGGYLLNPANLGKQGLVTLLNMFSVFERPIADIFSLIEADLSGAFFDRQGTYKGRRPANLMYPDFPYIRDGTLYLRSMSYDCLALVPLVMDFSPVPHDFQIKSYYTSEKQEKILSYARQTLEGIAQYHASHPDGMLRFFPFIGIHPEAHDARFIEDLLNTYLGAKTQPRLFYGVKLYPPLGTDPWPSDSDKREKVELIYRFCVEHAVPIVTHCDDQGFRGVSVKLAMQYTSPAAWRPVLEHYPDLHIDFAHYGRQYSLLGKPALRSLLENNFTSDPWFTQIIELMHTYEHVYADFSFSGTDQKFYEQLYTFINALDDADLASNILERSLFGSDFAVNLARVESYTNYLRIVESSPFSDKQIDGFVNANPLRFLGLDFSDIF